MVGASRGAFCFVLSGFCEMKWVFCVLRRVVDTTGRGRYFCARQPCCARCAMC